jgi:PST family polysaccharide transporter
MLSRQGKGFWEIIHNIGWMGSGRVIRLGGSLVVGAMVVRYLGPTGFGTFSYAMAIYGLFNILSNLGLDYLVVSDIALSKDVQAEEQVLGTSFLLKVGASLVTTIAATGYAWLTHPNEATVIAIVAMLSVASIAQGFDVIDYFFQAKTLSRLTVLPQLAVFLCSIMTRMIAVWLKCSLLTFGMIAALEILATELGFAFIYARRHKNLARWGFSKARAISLIEKSWPLTIASLLITIYMRSDQILLGSFCSKAIVGQYSAAVKLSEIWYSIPTIICASVMPRLLKGKDSVPSVYYARLQKLYNLMAGVSLVIALAVSFLGRYVIVLLFGSSYIPAANILAVHIWTGPLVFVGCVSGVQLIHENMTRVSLHRSAAGAVSNVLLNLVLIPKFGGIGSACATLIAQMLASYLMDGFSRSTRHIFRMKTKALFGFWLFSKSTIQREIRAL